MISLHRSKGLHLWTLYWHGKVIAGLISPKGFFVGRWLIVMMDRRLAVQIKGRRLL